MKRLLIILASVALLASCQTTQKELTPEERQEIADQVKKTFNESLELYRDLTVANFEKSLQYFVETDDPAWMGDPVMLQNMLYSIKTKERLDEVFRPDPNSNRKGQDYQEETSNVAVISDDCAVCVFTGKVAYTFKDTTPTIYQPISGSYVYVKKDGKWKCLHAHQSWVNE